MWPRIYSMLLCSALLASPLAGQVRVVGRVIDDLTELPIGQAQVSLLARGGSTLDRTETTSTGIFEFEVEGSRAIRLKVQRFGYAATTTPLLYFDDREFFQLEVRLDPDAILLAPLEVIAWSERPENALHEGFKLRLSTGLGTFITRAEVEQRKPVLVTDLLRTVPGVQVTGIDTGRRPTVWIGRQPWQDCTTQVFLDGFLMTRRIGRSSGDFRIDDAVAPKDIEGIEIYRGLSTVPAEFLNNDARCGVIAIWTRRGGNP